MCQLGKARMLVIHCSAAGVQAQYPCVSHECSYDRSCAYSVFQLYLALQHGHDG